ncbi:glycosyltransferase family 2 protein [Lachnospiraceae bacterium TF09-5]|jgi:hypothetical protein|nr:glycosyltransferase family 2 protein [Lachnospiraceae bacterium TF09-5]
MKKLAPLLVFVYNRGELTKQMLCAVNENDMAQYTDLYVFSDGPKKESDIENVAAVRTIIHDFSQDNKFRTIHVLEAEKNKGLANSIISGVTQIINKYGNVIVLEDDLIVAKNFLKFMNDCLDFYKDNNKIWSIGGTTFKLKSLDNYSKDIYACYRGTSWGWATWSDRWGKVDWEVSDYDAFMNDRSRKARFRRGGYEMVSALQKQMEGKTDSWAIRWCYQQSKENMFTILPKKNLVMNIGMNGSGTHSGNHDYFHTKLDNEKFMYMLEDVEISEKIMREFRKYFLPLWPEYDLAKCYVNKVIDKFKKIRSENLSEKDETV